jgi:hypothetical protein
MSETFNLEMGRVYSSVYRESKNSLSLTLDFFIIFLMLSQGISLLYPLTGTYFPNEKIAVVLVSIISLSYLKVSRFPTSFLFFVVFSSIIVFLISYWRNLIYGIEINRTDLNFILCFLSYIFYFSYFQNRWKSILSILPAIALIAVSFSLLQNLIMNFGDERYALLLHNYYSQDNYKLAQSSLTLFYRTNSFFTESSSLGLFYVFYLSIYYFSSIPFKKTKFHKIINLLVFIDIFFTFSSTAILVLFIVFLRNMRKVLPKINKFFIISILTLVVVFIAGSIYDKIKNTLLLDSSYPRMLSIINNFNLVIDNYFWTGIGPSWDQPSWDIFSIIFTYYGFLGVVTIVPFMLFLLFKCSFNFRMVNLGIFLAIGTPMNGLNIFVIIFSIVLTQKLNQKIEYA